MLKKELNFTESQVEGESVYVAQGLGFVFHQ